MDHIQLHAKFFKAKADREGRTSFPLDKVITRAVERLEGSWEMINSLLDTSGQVKGAALGFIHIGSMSLQCIAEVRVAEEGITSILYILDKGDERNITRQLNTDKYSPGNAIKNKNDGTPDCINFVSLIRNRDDVDMLAIYTFHSVK